MTTERSRGGKPVGNLPAETTRLIGRGTELNALRELCERSRLVTLTGVGGVGKTRLARAAAAELRPRLRDGAWLVELSPLSEGALLAHTIADALPLVDRTTRPVIDVLADYLADRETLLVLDTCEHLTDACAMAVEVLLRAAPGLRILATSRRALGVVGEEVLAVEPLPVPVTCDPAAGEADAVTLLAERAAETVPGFAVTDANRADLLALCRRLEGLPLALELAAARLGELPVRELTGRLDDRFAVLGDPGRNASGAGPPWHQGLRTAIGWSHELCTPAERLLWARLSVFAGSFDAETARDVCSDDRLPDDEIPALLGTLAEKSILIWQPTGGGERYRMLDTLREYGAGWLRRLGEEEQLRCRHLEFYRALARRGDAGWIGPEQYAWHDRMNAEHDNLRAALEFALAEPAGRTALELAGALWFFWYSCGFPKEGRHYLERALAADTRPSPARIKALHACGQAISVLGDPVAVEALAAECAAAAGHFGATEAALATALDMYTATQRGDLTRAASVAESLLAPLRRGEPPTFDTLAALVMRSQAAIVTGRIEDAMATLDELSFVCDLYGERCARAGGDLTRAQAELARGRTADARRYARSALEVKRRLRDGLGTAMSFDVLAQVAVADGRCEPAARLLGLAQQRWDTLGRHQIGIPAWVAARRACEQRARAALGDDAYRLAFRAGYESDPDTGIDPLA
ncbi:ATP-binding protein [Streptomyces sp. NPDC053542]|uniref:ATP-binding protein n=1 Tax=Streptomyces sp. NPDC053542 TaxID=3365710 RepID=UPI0037D3DDB3